MTVTDSSITAGDVLTLAINGNLLSQTYTFNKTVLSTDTPTSIASAFVTAINGTSGLTQTSPKDIHVYSSSSAGVLTLTSDAILVYTQTTKNKAGVVEAATEYLTLSGYNFPSFAVLPICGGNLPFAGYIAQNSAYICGTLQLAQVTGTPHVGDVLSITMSDTHLSPNPYVFKYTIVAADANADDLVTDIAKAFNNTSELAGQGISAVARGSILRLTSGTFVTTYSVSDSVTGYESFTLNGSTQNGQGDTYNNAISNSAATLGFTEPLNAASILQTAWNADFTIGTNNGITSWYELFADETAIVAGQTTDTNQTQDEFLQSGHFNCTETFVRSIEVTGLTPGNTPNYSYSSQCK